jgi:hypothetical protein
MRSSLTHPCLGLPARRYLGREPYAYQAMRVLAERGEMMQADFMRLYWSLGAKGNSFLNNFGAYATRPHYRPNDGTRFPILQVTQDNGRVLLRWIGPRVTLSPDWRPDHVIAEDHYAA